MLRYSGKITIAVVLLTIVFNAAAGCIAPEQPSKLSQPSPTIAATSLPVATTATKIPVQTTAPETPERTTIPSPVTTPIITAIPTTTQVSEAAINARIVDARNKLDMLIDSNVADTVIVHPDGTQNCEVKKSRELGYLIDVSTGESTFIKGDYWSIDGSLFTDKMKKDREYIIIHTHPRVWATCGGSGVISLYTFSIGDLEAVANMTEQGYHVDKLIAVADKDHRIWPRQKDGWKSEREVRQAVRQIEAEVGRPFSYYDPLLDHEFYDVDNLMPLLAKELDYSFTINNMVIS